MFGPGFSEGCATCSTIADGFDGFVIHLANHDVTPSAVSRAPLAKLQAYKRRMGWSFPWASSFDTDFNYDFHVAHTKEEWDSGAVDYNFREVDFRPAEESPVLAEWASSVGTDFATYRREGPGVSAFVLEDGVVYHPYSAYERGADFGVARYGRRAATLSVPPLGVLGAFSDLVRAVGGQVTLEVAELHPDRVRSSCSLRPAATLASSSSGESIRRRASMTFSRASSLSRP